MMKAHISQACHGLNCRNTILIKAHIIPKAFGRLFKGDGPNMQLSMHASRPASPQLGEYDENILCAACDNKLGVYDNYAVGICRRFPSQHNVLHNNNFEMNDIDGDKFSKFILAVLWRASISKRVIFSDIELGKYEDLARDVLFDAKPMGKLSAFRVLLQRYTSEHLDVTGFYTLPKRVNFDRWNSYGFAVGGFRVAAILDSRSMPSAIAHYLINRNDVLRGSFKSFEETFEFKTLANMVVSEAVRRGVPPWELKRRKKRV